MRKFILRTLLFCLPFLVAYPIDYVLSDRLASTSAYWGEYEVINDVKSSRINADILIYGSSRAWHHYDPEIFKDSLHKSVYNLGMDGQNFSFQYFFHNYYLKFNKSPSLIIHSLDNFTFDKRDYLVNKNKFVPYALWDNDIRNFVLRYEGFSMLDCYIPLIRYSGEELAGEKLLNLALNKKSNKRKSRNSGYQPLEGKKSLQKLLKETRDNSFNVELDKELIADYYKFILELKQKNITLIMVYSPEQREVELVLPERRYILELYARIAKETNTVFYNYSTDSLSLDKSMFYDITHLNKKGAEKFSSDLCKRLKLEQGITVKTE